MRHKANTRSSLFLMEMIVAILFFSLASAVCLRMFAKSHQLSTDAAVLNQAVNQTDNIAELIKYDSEHGSDTLTAEYPDADITADYADSVIYFDQNWKACTSKQATYKLIIREQTVSATLKQYTLDMYGTSDSKDAIYELPLSIHIAREVTAHE